MLCLNSQNPYKMHWNCRCLLLLFESKKTIIRFYIYRNGTKFEEHTIQVDSLENDRHYNHSMSLFLGNLSFKTTDDEVMFFSYLPKLTEFLFLNKNSSVNFSKNVAKSNPYVLFVIQKRAWVKVLVM